MGSIREERVNSEKISAFCGVGYGRLCEQGVMVNVDQEPGSKSRSTQRRGSSEKEVLRSLAYTSYRLEIMTGHRSLTVNEPKLLLLQIGRSRTGNGTRVWRFWCCSRPRLPISNEGDHPQLGRPFSLCHKSGHFSGCRKLIKRNMRLTSEEERWTETRIRTDVAREIATPAEHRRMTYKPMVPI